MPRKPKQSASADTSKTAVFKKLVRIPIDAEATKIRADRNTAIDLQIEKHKEEMKPTKEKVTALRAEKRKLLEDMGVGTTEQEAEVYEVKDFRKGEAVIFLAENDTEVGRRTLEKSDYQVDSTETAAEPPLTPGDAIRAAREHAAHYNDPDEPEAIA